MRNTVILGVTTNVRFLRDVLAHPVFQHGEVTTNFVERAFTAWRPDVAAVSDLALIAAALTDAQSPADSPTTHPPSGAAHFDPWQANDGFRIGG